MSRSAVDAITSRTLSKDDIAAATIATKRNEETTGKKTPSVTRRVGTTRSVSVRLSPITLWAKIPMGTKRK